jgi:pilus assembly protein CpaE
VKECGLSSGTPHIAGGSLCLITVALDPEAADIAKQVAVQESVQFLNTFPDYAPNLLNAQLAQPLQEAQALACLIDFDKSKDLAVQTAAMLQPLVSGRTALIALSDDANPDLILNAMRAGCSEYLTKPLRSDELSSSLQKLRARWLSSTVRPDHPAGQVLAFLSVRGGAGATTAAVHLGTFLAKRHVQKVLIVDLHPHLGHVAMLLGIDSRSYNFPELLRNISRLDLTLLNSYVVHHSSGVDVLLSPDSLSETTRISADELGRAIRFLADVYDYVLIDCTSGLDELNQTTIGCCNEVFLVATPEVPALRDLARYVDRLLEGYAPPEKLKVVINQHGSHRAVTVDQIEKAIRHPVSITLPTSSTELIRAVDTGEPVSPEKRSEFASQIKNWASMLAPAKEGLTDTKRRFAFWS